MKNGYVISRYQQVKHGERATGKPFYMQRLSIIIIILESISHKLYIYIYIYIGSLHIA